MIDKSCLRFDGDEDCNKCTVNGYIFSCPFPCPDYRGFFNNQQAVTPLFSQNSRVNNKKDTK